MFVNSYLSPSLDLRVEIFPFQYANIMQVRCFNDIELGVVYIYAHNIYGYYNI